MSLVLPQVPDRGLLADRCREAGAVHTVQPYLVEKDFYLTRLLWALGGRFGEQLLLKGGTLLSKVDLGFFRMSEDADVVIPEPASHNKGANMRRINVIRDALTDLEPVIGAKRRFPSGEDSAKGSHRRWDLDYPSEFGAQSIQLEVSLRPEARAEKVRAAFTREAIRDFYDLDRLMDAGSDLTSKRFLSLVNVKLAEVGAPNFEDHVQPFGLDARRRRSLEHSLKTELPAVLRADAPPFDLDRMLTRFERLWADRPPA